MNKEEDIQKLNQNIERRKSKICVLTIVKKREYLDILNKKYLRGFYSKRLHTI